MSGHGHRASRSPGMIWALCCTEQEATVQVRRTVVHEVAHHFGIDDDWLGGLGW